SILRFFALRSSEICGRGCTAIPNLSNCLRIGLPAHAPHSAKTVVSRPDAENKGELSKLCSRFRYEFCTTSGPSPVPRCNLGGRLTGATRSSGSGFISFFFPTRSGAHSPEETKPAARVLYVRVRPHRS